MYITLFGGRADSFWIIQRHPQKPIPYVALGDFDRRVRKDYYPAILRTIKFVTKLQKQAKSKDLEDKFHEIVQELDLYSLKLKAYNMLVKKALALKRNTRHSVKISTN